MSLVPLFDGKDSIYLPSHSSNLEDHMRVWMDLGGAPAPAYLWRGAPTYLSLNCARCQALVVPPLHRKREITWLM